ncbi:uncharacterized protein AC631_01860 [Debaryomyces fabryi]|uniref:Pheromone a factor receptor n=1 Tax=Debaryomyces fabryi TaxID=58627 RepID=A0A0V1Q1V5_9ASCO|nr:uncharacterized protein AC631_01860 [Debaryomyces fabryi]KSA02396.1 hypothetical protein AC631_01860 [Debaryomyces fabryi]
MKLEAASSSGMICAISALAFNLFMVLWAKYPAFMNNGSKMKMWISLGMCLITPIFIMCTNYIIQTSRYIIVKYRGCTVTYALSPVSIVLYSMWNIIWAAVAVVFSVLTLAAYCRKRKDVKDILRCTNSGLNIKRFARLLIFNVLIVIALVPVAVYFFVSDFSLFEGDFVWSEIHNEYWGEIFFFDFGIEIVYDRWVNIALSVVTFLLFGLGSDALEMYKNGLCVISLGRLFNKSTKSDSHHLELFHLTKNNSPTSQFALSKMSTQTRVGSNRSELSKPAMCEFRNGFNEINDDSTLGGSSTLNAHSPEEKSFDLEKGIASSNSISDYFNEEEIASKDELKYIMSQTLNNGDDGFDYNYQVKKK